MNIAIPSSRDFTPTLAFTGLAKTSTWHTVRLNTFRECTIGSSCLIQPW